MPHLTLGWLTLINTSQPDVISAAANAGFTSASIRITGRKPNDGFPTIVGDKAAMGEIKKRLADNGMRLSNTSIYHVSPDITLEMLLPAIEATVELGAKILVTTCTDPDHERWVAFMARYCEAARQAGLVLAFEFVPFSEAKTIGVAYDLIQRTGASNFGLLVDALHLSRSGGIPSDIRKVDPSRIVFAQLCDARELHPPPDQLASEARTGRLYPGDGALPLYEFLDALPDGIEIECEIPRGDYAELSPDEQARRAGDATRTFLQRYCELRGRPVWK